MKGNILVPEKFEKWELFEDYINFLRRMFPSTAPDIRLGDWRILREQFAHFDDKIIGEMAGFVLRNCVTFPSISRLLEICYNYRSLDIVDAELKQVLAEKKEPFIRLLKDEVPKGGSEI